MTDSPATKQPVSDGESAAGELLRDWLVRAVMVALIIAAIVPFVIGFWFQLFFRAFARGREEFERMGQYIDEVGAAWSVTPAVKPDTAKTGDRG